MRCTILKSFPLARDGIHAEQLTKGQEADVPESLVEGLQEAGFVEPAPKPEPEPEPGTGESPASGQDPQPSSSEAGPASTEKTSSDAGEPTRQEVSEPSPSTAEPSAADAGSPPTGQTSSTPETHGGGKRPEGRRRSKGSR